MGVDFDPDQAIELDAFSRELDRLSQLNEPSKPTLEDIMERWYYAEMSEEEKEVVRGRVS